MPIRKHRCPARGCTTEIPDTLLACLPHWGALPQHIRTAVYDTRHLSLLDPKRRAVMQAALEVWKDETR